MTKPVAFRQDDMRRALAAARAEGVSVARIVVRNEGFEIVVGEPEKPGKVPRNALDRLHAA